MSSSIDWNHTQGGQRRAIPWPRLDLDCLHARRAHAFGLGFASFADAWARRQEGGLVNVDTVPGAFAHPTSPAHRIVGITNSAPSLVPDGQRDVTVLVLV